jgi:hypothetical protein
MSAPSDPVITRHDDGRLTVEWPDPPRPFYDVALFYDVAHDVIQQWVNDLNERRARDEAIIRATMFVSAWRLNTNETALVIELAERYLSEIAEKD